MPRNYTKVEHLAAEIFHRKSAGETNRQIAESSYHLTLEQVKGLIARQNRKTRLIKIYSCAYTHISRAKYALSSVSRVFAVKQRIQKLPSRRTAFFHGRTLRRRFFTNTRR